MRTDRQHRCFACGQRGLTLLEVLVTIVILAFGLLGLAGLQARMQVAELESYQRAQAIVLLEEMVDRIKANPKNAMSYVPAPLGKYTIGTGTASQNCAALPGTPTQADIDLCEWNNALLGATEISGGGDKLGAMIGARGCVENTKDDMPRDFLISVVWQGLAATKEPVSTNCGEGLYNDGTRRAIVARITIACLQNKTVGTPPVPTTECVTP